MKTLADALVQAQVVDREKHPEVAHGNYHVRGWLKALRWVQKQKPDFLRRLCQNAVVNGGVGPSPELLSVPKYIDPHRVRMIARSFILGYDGEPFRLDDVAVATTFLHGDYRLQIIRGIKLGYQTWRTAHAN